MPYGTDFSSPKAGQLVGGKADNVHELISDAVLGAGVTLTNGAGVKVADIANTNLKTVVTTREADTDDIYGIVLTLPSDAKSSYAAGEQVKILRSGVVWMETATSLAGGAKVSLDRDNAGRVVAAGSNTVLGTCLTKVTVAANSTAFVKIDLDAK